MTGSEFGSRSGLYERLYSGDPEINRNVSMTLRHSWS
jgi:aromatic ring hydroxylase